MKKIISLLLCLSIITLVSCTDKNAEIYSNHTADVSNQNEESTSSDSGEDVTERELSGTLEISSCWKPEEFYGWLRSAREFAKIHPNVQIQLNNNTMITDIPMSAQEWDVAVEKYYSDLKVKMLSGNPPDLIINDDDFASHFVSSGLIYDLNKFIEGDAEFIKEDYFMNVIEAQEVNGGLYVFPTEIDIESVRIRKDVLESLEIEESSLETVDYKFLYDIYYKTIEGGEFPEIEYMFRKEYTGKAILSEEERAVAFDADKMTVNFEDLDFIEYLETTSKYEAARFSFGVINPSGEIFDETNYMVEGSKASNKSPGFYIDEHINATNPIPVVNSRGELLIKVINGMSIPTGAKNAQLAWEFVKFHVSETEDMAFYNSSGQITGYRDKDAVFINKSYFEKNMQITNGSIWESEEDKGKYNKYILNALELPIATGFTDIDINLALDEVQSNLYKGLMTAEECAKAMQDRAEIYFAEIE